MRIRRYQGTNCNNLSDYVTLLLVKNHRLKSADTVIASELFNNFQNNSLEPVLFLWLNTIRLSRPKYLVTSLIDFEGYNKSFASIKSLLDMAKNAQGLMETIVTEWISPE